MRLSPTLVALSLMSPLVAEDDAQTPETEPVTVVAEGVPTNSPGSAVLLMGKPVVDAGEALRSIPGVDGIRMGGHGIDPVLRGQQREAIRITIDGAETVGGCPNRMDPPSSFATLPFYDSISVEKGRHTITDGSAGPAGHIRFERHTEPLAEGERARGRFVAGYVDNGSSWSGAGDVTVGEGPWYARFQVGAADAHDYTDGNGRSVASAFTKIDGALVAGYRPADDLRIELLGEVGRIDDATFAGAPMDAPLTERTRLGARIEWTPMASLRAIRAEAHLTQVEHIMDNHTLRLRTAGMPLRTESETATLGGRLEVEVGGDALFVSFGMDHRDVHQEAQRYGPADRALNPALAAWQAATGMSDTQVHRYTGVSTLDDGNVHALQSLMWPDVDTRNTGFFAEMTAKPLEWATLIAGVRIDAWEQVAASAGMPVDPTDPLSMAQGSYLTYYGAPLGDASRLSVGGLLRLEGQHLEEALDWYAGLSRSVRQPDATERTMFATLPPMMATNRWIGNPTLKAEIHHQIDAGISYEEALFSVGVDGFYNDIQDKIIRERAHSPWGATASVLQAAPMVPMSVRQVLTGWTMSFVPDGTVADYLTRQVLAPQVASAWARTGGAAIAAEAALREVWRGRDVTLAYDRARIYRNVDAVLAGAEVMAGLTPLDGLSITGSAAYTYGQNQTDDKPLAQIPPLSGSLQLLYTWKMWEWGLRGEGQLRQDRIDGSTWNASGDDIAETPAWGVVDCHVAWRALDTLEIRAGVDNLFDRSYARHLNRANSIDADALRVNEPGRTFWLQTLAEF